METLDRIDAVAKAAGFFIIGRMDHSAAVPRSPVHSGATSWLVLKNDGRSTVPALNLGKNGQIQVQELIKGTALVGAKRRAIVKSTPPIKGKRRVEGGATARFQA